MTQEILTSIELRKRIQNSIFNCKSIQIISAYLTETAVEWLSDILLELVDVTIIGRFIPADFANGASSIQAVSKALDHGWKIACLPDLHAKIYVIDRSKMFVGSANFTCNGLKLHGQGNLEASIETEPSSSNLEFVDNIVSNSFPITYKTLAKMERYVNQHKEILRGATTFIKWPINIIPKDQKIWVTNFPWLNLNDENGDESAIKHDHYEFGNNNEMFFQSKAYSWLCAVLKEKENCEIYYGELSARLHSDLIDDPKPYRKEVKVLLSNLLSYCEKFAKKEVQIDRPSYSQRIKLISNAC